MRLSRLKVQNFRALKEVELSLSQFACVIGENNAGKSSLLHAILRFIDGQKLVESDYYDPAKAVEVEMDLKITEDDLKDLAEEHRPKIETALINGELKLRRRFILGLKSELLCFRNVPREDRWKDDVLSEKLKGKKPLELKALLQAEYPELAKDLPASLTQKEIKERAERFRQTLAADQLVAEYNPLPTGVDNSITAIMPEPIYIQAVKDIADDIKSKDSATFGKVLGLLLNAVQPRFDAEKELFTQLDRKLNPYTNEAGTTVDDRLEEIKQVEALIQGNLKENFPQASVAIRIPPPDIKTILQAARINIHDGGIEGPIETKGDGLKRSVLFALFRAYVNLSKLPGWNPKASSGSGRPRYLFLFEEPELYLHPRAQQSLFDALALVSKDFQVVVTTHSPLFFSADKTTSFVKIAKLGNPAAPEKPFSRAFPVDLTEDIPAKDAFQVLCYENNNVAFFANEVVLVEGDSDIIAFKHIARALNPAWDFDGGRVRIVKVNGKGNFKRFSDFFKRFEIKPLILSDLDLLVRDFDKTGIVAGSPLFELRTNLLELADKKVAGENGAGDAFKRLFERRTWQQRGEHFFSIAKAAKAGKGLSDEDVEFLKVLIEAEQQEPRLEILRDHADVRATKHDFLRDLRKDGILVLAKGAIEDYYPEGLTGTDKPTKADSFRKSCATRESVVGLSEEVPTSCGGKRRELEAIFSHIFEGSDRVASAAVPALKANG